VTSSEPILQYRILLTMNCFVMSVCLAAAWIPMCPALALDLDTGDDGTSKIPITIKLREPADKNSKASFVVAGLAEKELKELGHSHLKQDQWTALFSVYVDRPEKNEKTPPPVLGSYRVEGKLLIFEPRFPLSPGVHYRAVFEPGRLPTSNPPQGKSIVAKFTIPKLHSTPSTKVEHVYPSADVLPENQLKFYIHFTAPMSKGEAYTHVHLMKSSGQEVDLPFLRLEEELWNEKQTRFTLLFDPGRIKRGLKPREEVGPALEEGKSYILVIDRDWNDADGNPLKESYRKSFRARPPDDNPIDVKTWKLKPPSAGTRNPFQVAFPKPLDHALLERVISVANSTGHQVVGTVAVTDNETRWSFTPQKPWQPGSYNLTADTTLEDLAGNSIGKPFEIDVFHPIQRQVKSETVRIPFQIAPSN
jgi:hypothetical protein